ncbi:hypothetical protein KZ483_17910 [Paenibacillus sp. sptzw28]|uniref:hypothetical protein n=1 Tax=Paenibacillus sp. sptzw28 TaxID=715179 RepID=UPI001C6EDD97|nr:hypothetical protein [Paenibacillus sp. sptzw28]QYR19749.1 hypothetical protein KZ483_17910 [Paenibacillus sp. sptzw28]
MIGTWRWNITLGLCGVLLTLLFSLGSNGFQITSLRCIYAFIAFFALAYLFRALLAIISQPSAIAPVESLLTDGTRGSTVDLSTPDESQQLNEMLKKQMDGNGIPEHGELTTFQPLSPPKLVSTQNKEPEELAKAIRHLTGG